MTIKNIRNWLDRDTPFQLKSVTLNQCVDVDVLWEWRSYVSLKKCSYQYWTSQKWFFENGYLINAITRKVLADDLQGDALRRVVQLDRLENDDKQKWLRIESQ